jgi:hypothetical protein
MQALGSAPRSGRLARSVRAVKRKVTLQLGSLGRETVEGQARAHGLSIPALLRYSATYYLSERAAGRLAWRVPRFARSARGIDHEGRLDVTLELDDNDWRSLEAEAEAQHVPLALLLEHAAFLLVNDLACGRVALSGAGPSDRRVRAAEAGPPPRRARGDPRA